jgi:hypothetical protein
MEAIAKPISQVNGQRFIDAARGKHVIPYDAFPEAGFAFYGKITPKAMLNKFGVQYANYLGYTWRMEKIRNACAIASQDAPEGIRRWSRDLAALSMGCAYPMELTSKVFLQTFAKNQPVVRVSVYSSSAPKKTHAFLISGDIDRITNASMQGKKVAEFLGELQNCTILDPFVNSICRIEHFGSSSTHYYLELLGADTLGASDYVRPSPDALAEYQNICATAKKIEEKARSIFSSPENTNEQIKLIGSFAMGAAAELGLPLDEFF